MYVPHSQQFASFPLECMRSKININYAQQDRISRYTTPDEISVVCETRLTQFPAFSAKIDTIK